MAFQTAAGDHTAALGIRKVKWKEKVSDNVKTESTIANMSGPVSDGLNYHFQLYDIEFAKYLI